MTLAENDSFARRTGIGADDLRLLGRLPLFSGLAPEALRGLLADSAVQRVARGTVLFLQGEPATRFYAVLEGWVKLFRETRDGQESVLGVFRSGESFAEAAMFASKVFPVSAAAVEDARLLVIPAGSFLSRLAEDPALCLKMMASMSAHMRMLVHQVEQITARSTTQRLAGFLVKLCAADRGEAVVRLPMDKSLIAGRLGMKPETLSRSLAKLRAFGVETTGRELMIRDVGALRAHFEED
jgi:CRP-like cAMP-binding protein